MAFKDDLISDVNSFFDGNYTVTQGTVIPDVSDLTFSKTGRELDLAMLFIDISKSTKIVDASRRITAAKMYKSFLYGVAQIARHNNGELRSFNGDGVLIAFIGDYKRTNAAKAALQMSWFMKHILKPKMEAYFQSNNELQGFLFNFGIGIDVGKILVVRGGIRGENNNDLVWVGNATNYAVKLAELCGDVYHIYISSEAYKMNESSIYGGNPRKNMWEARTWTAMGGITVYCSNWTWTPE